VVAVRTRTAGQPALRCRIIIDQPGISMPGAAACALPVCDCDVNLIAVASHRSHCSPASASLPLFPPLPERLHRPARRSRTGVAPVMGKLRLRVSGLHSGIPAHRAEAFTDLISGMDIADRNTVAAVTPSAPHCSFRPAPVGAMAVAGRELHHQGSCVLPDPVAYVVQCARRLLRTGNLSAAGPPWGWSSKEGARCGSNNAGKDPC
jgi:hypothetical protein